MSLDLSFERRFGGLRRLYGPEGAERIFGAHVVVVGIGGVGSWTAEALARSGVGHLTLIDMDHVSESNTNRQIHALETHYGQAKVVAMRERIALINPQARVDVIDDFVAPGNWLELAAQIERVSEGKGFAVIDACDQVAAKTTLANWARESGALFITVGAAGGKRMGHLVEVADLSQTTHDPLLAQLRYRLRRQHAAPKQGLMDVPCVFSREAVSAPDPSCVADGAADGSLNCQGYGSSVSVTGTFGLCAAGWVMNALAEQKKPRKFRRASKEAKKDAII